MKVNFKQIIPIAALVALSASAFAQGPGFGGPPPGGFGGPGMQMSPEAMAKMQAWRKWRDAHKNVGAVQRSLRAIGQIEQDPRTRLTKSQAGAILSVIGRWRGKAVMTDAQARQVNQQLTTPLSIPQLKMFATLSAPRRGGPGGGGGFGGGRPGGAPGGGRGGFDPSKMPAPREYNPLNPASMPMERQRQRAKDELDRLTAALKAIH